MTPLIIVAAIGAITGYAAYRFERREWNHGRCPKCGSHWRYFDTDSQGGRGYKCDGCGNVTWISWFNENKDTVPEVKS